MTCEPTQTPIDVDVVALREKYRRERDKRLRPEGSRQYIETSADFAEFWETDPHSPAVVRDPLDADVEVVVLGGGFAGLIAAARLKQAGVDDVRVVEMGGDFGGVWYWNRYPGIQCDNESYCYLPMLEELGYLPSKKFVDGAEIYEHCRTIGKHFGLYDGALFGTQVRGLRWDDDITRWRVSTNHDDDLRARFVVMASGPWNKPKLPGIEGINHFSGHSFHSSRWDYTYTGGSPSDPILDRLADKRVAVIGTGATAIQIVPFLGRFAEHLYVFQRTPSSVDERGNRATDPNWAATLQPGWQRQRQANFHAWAWEAFPPGSGEPDLVCDFWTEIGRNMAATLSGLPEGTQPSVESLIDLREIEDFRVMERLRRRIDDIVTDPDTAEALKPYYRFMCKRPCSNDDYLPMFNRPNVTLVDVSAPRGVDRLTKSGIVANGVEYEVDCVIYASGFEIATEIRRRYGIATIEGRDGVSLYDRWADGFQTFHGMTSHGFPNQFFTGFTQAGVGANNTAMYEQQAVHIAYLIGQTLARGATTVEPSSAAQHEWVRTIRESAPPAGDFAVECTPGYYNNEGGGAEGIRSPLGEPYGPGFYAFDDLLASWRADGSMAGLLLDGQSL
jgi:cyclohexanone monooxygenase